jgi:hypothetical protein
MNGNSSSIRKRTLLALTPQLVPSKHDVVLYAAPGPLNTEDLKIVGQWQEYQSYGLPGSFTIAKTAGLAAKQRLYSGQQGAYNKCFPRLVRLVIPARSLNQTSYENTFARR